MAQSEYLYLQYIDLYKYNPDDAAQVIYIFKRPLHRIRLLAKLFKVRPRHRKLSLLSSIFLCCCEILTLQKHHQYQNETNALRNAPHPIAETYADLDNAFSNLVHLARTKLDSEMEEADTNRFLFNKVCSLETLKPVSASLDKNLIRQRAFFEFELNHAQGTEWFPLMVEALLLASPESNGIIDSLALCTLEEPGRGLLFPAFRYRDLKIHAMSAPFSSSPSGTVNRFITLANSSKNQFTLRCPDEDQFQTWRDYLEGLFPHEEEWDVSMMTEGEEISKDESLSRDTSYSFSSRREDILSQSFHGLNIISTSSVSSGLANTSTELNEAPLLKLPSFSFSGYNLSPQLELFQSTPSLTEDSDLKAFLSEDFDFSENVIESSFKTKQRPLSMLEVVAHASPIEDVEIESLSEPSDISDSEYKHNNHGPSFVIVGDDESVSSFFSLSKEQENSTAIEERIKETAVPPKHIEHGLATPEVTIPSAVLPMRFPPCPPTPVQSAERKTTMIQQLPTIGESFSANVSSPLTPKIGTVPSMVLKYEASCESLRDEKVRQTLAESKLSQVAPSPTLKRKTSSGKRFVSVFKNFSAKLKSKPSIAPIEEDEGSVDACFEMLDTTPRMREVENFQESEEPRHIQFPSGPAAPQQNPILNRGNPMRASRALSKISEEVILEDFFDEEDEDDEDDEDDEVRVEQPPVIQTARAARMASPSLIKMSNGSLSSSLEDEAGHSTHSAKSSIGTAIAIESNNGTVQSGHSRTFSNTVSLRSLRRDNSSGSVSSKSTTHKSSSESTLTGNNHRKNTSSSSTRSCMSIMRIPTAMVSHWDSSSWTQVSDIPLSLNVSVTAVGHGLISCNLPLSSSQDSLVTAYEEDNSKAVFELSLNASTHVRKRSTYDVHVRQGSDVYLFRLRTSALALEFAKKVDLSRQSSFGQALLRNGGNVPSMINSSTQSSSRSLSSCRSLSSTSLASTGLSSISRGSSMGSISSQGGSLSLNIPLLPHCTSSGSLASPVSDRFTDRTKSVVSPSNLYTRPYSLITPPASSRGGSYHSLPNSSTDTLKRQHTSDSAEVLELKDIRCRIFLRPASSAITPAAAESQTATLWTDAGLARVHVFSVPREPTMHRVTLLKPAADDALIDARLPGRCFERAGPVGLKICDPASGVSKYLLRMRNKSERDQVAATLGC